MATGVAMAKLCGVVIAAIACANIAAPEPAVAAGVPVSTIRQLLSTLARTTLVKPV